MHPSRQNEQISLLLKNFHPVSHQHMPAPFSLDPSKENGVHSLLEGQLLFSSLPVIVLIYFSPSCFLLPDINKHTNKLV